MATVASLIRAAFRTMGVLASSETASAAEQADALVSLNDMLDSWAGERLALFATLRSLHVLTPGLSPHTIGLSGTFDTTRPVRIDAMSILPAGTPGSERPLTLLTDAEWQGQQGKGNEGTPYCAWVETSYPLLKLHLHPVPVTADTLVLYTWQQLGRFASAAADFDFPPGYARAIRYNLAKELAPEYGLTLSAEAQAIAEESKSTLKRLNHKEAHLVCDAAVLQNGRFDVVNG